MLIVMATYCTKENQRFLLARRTLLNLVDNALFRKNRLVVMDNGSDDGDMKELCEYYGDRKKHLPCDITYIRNYENRGTARAINRGLQMREPGEVCCKIDDDVIIRSDTWIAEIEEAFRRDSKLGIIGLKRKDLAESPSAIEKWYRSSLKMLPHKPGESWMVVEEVNHVMGTCQAYSPALLDKVGYLWQPGLYGFDDSDICARAHLAGFDTVFLPHIDIDHIDPGGTEFTQWKRKQAGITMQEYRQAIDAYKSGKQPLYREATI